MYKPGRGALWTKYILHNERVRSGLSSSVSSAAWLPFPSFFQKIPLSPPPPALSSSFSFPPFLRFSPPCSRPPQSLSLSVLNKKSSVLGSRVSRERVVLGCLYVLLLLLLPGAGGKPRCIPPSPSLSLSLSLSLCTHICCPQ